MNTTQEKIQDLVDRIPALDAKRGTFTGPAWEDAAQILDAVLALGRDGVIGVVGLVQDVDDGNDYKARYVLHALAQYLGRPGKEAARATFVEALASQLGGDRPKGAQGFVARQLHVVGGKDCAPALGKLLGDPDLSEYAAQALLSVRAGAVEEFRKALPNLKGAQRLTAIQALGVLADAESADAFRKAAVDEDLNVRLAALWGLARIADPGAVDLVLKRADVEPGWERIKATSAALLLAERLLAAGRKDESARIYRHLKDTRSDPSEGYVRDAAQEGLARAGA